jgi:hypothetical protein
MRRNLVPTYGMTSYSVWLENRPDVCKLHLRALPVFRRNLPQATFMMSIGQLHQYIELDWEVGITNEFKVLQQQGLSKAQLMEIVMAAQVYAGVRGLEAVYRATWPFLRDMQDRPEPAQFPEAWAPDTDAFKAGLDPSTAELTEHERRSLEKWYMNNGGEIPKWVTFMIREHPDFVKAYRLRWEGSFRGALPKQVMPFLMIYQNVANGYRDGLRSAALLARAWGVSRDWIMLALIGAAFFYTGMEGLDMAQEAIGDILQ